MSIWIVVPVYRDVRSFTVLRERLLDELARPAGEVRFVVVDDTAGLDPQIEELLGLDDVTVLRPPIALGHQRAIVYGLRKSLPAVADDDLLVTLDADGEDKPEDIRRLLAPLQGQSQPPQQVALALRTKRKKSIRFRAMYALFRVLFRTMTGAMVRTGNYAAMPGSLAKKALLHPTFDLSYSSAILAVDLPIAYVPCERGERYEGHSKMTYGRLAMHGLRMMMPFVDRIAIRALAAFATSLALGLLLAAVVVSIKLFTDSAIPGWATLTVLGALVASLVSLGNFVTLFVIFSQHRAVSLAEIEGLTPAAYGVTGPEKAAGGGA